MTVTYHGGNILRGTTAERTGGTWTNLPAGWIFIESDGLAIYYWTGTIWSLVGSAGGTLAIAGGGTGQTTATAAFDALSPMTAVGDIILGSTAGTRTRLAVGTANQALKVNSGGTTLDYGTLPVAGGGTGAATLTGILKGNGTSAVTASNTLAGITLTTPIVNGIRETDLAKVTGDSPYTALATDRVIRIDNSASTTAFVLNLPTAASIGGTRYTVVRTDVLASTNITVITPSGSETIGSCALWRLFPGEFVEIESDGTNWQVTAQPGYGVSGYYRQKNSTNNRRYVAGISYCGESAFVNSSTLPLLNTLYAFPLIVSRVTKFDTITFKHIANATAGGVARAGIYRDNGNVYPGALIFDTGSKAVDSGSGTAIDTTITAGLQIFQPGLYWLAWECGTAQPQVLTLTNPTGLLNIIGHENTFSTANRAGYGYTVAHTFAALPDPYTAGAAILNQTPGATLPSPAIGLRPI